jgi:hypothetical protein
MKTLLTLVASALCAQAALAAELPSFATTGFGYVGIKALRQGAAEPVPPAAGAPQDKLNKAYLFLQCGKDKMFGYADTKEQYQEAVAFWKPIFAANGITMGETSFEDKFIKIAYTTKDGSVIRDYWAEPQQFKPKDEASLRENRDMVLGELSKTHKVIASYLSDLDFMLPTYKAYYLVKPDAVQEHEDQLRVLRPGEDIDFDVFEKLPGVKIVQKPETWMMVYIGPELGFVSRIGHDRAEIEKKVKDRVDYLVGVGKVMIDTRIKPIDEGEWKFLGNIYFYQ